MIYKRLPNYGGYMNKLMICFAVAIITGHASYYGPGFHGKTMANGVMFNQYAATVAHKTLKLGTKLKITNTSNGRSTIATVTDRGPYVGKRVLDLSYGVMRVLGGLDSGVVNVSAEVVEQ
jgi:rare lipoprotein A